MRPPDPITEFAASLAQELAFDPALARRVRAEVEDHLQEAVAEERGDPSGETQRRAIAAFGSAREIARQYAAASLLSQVRRVTALIAVAVIGVFGVMKARIAWYEAMQWQPSQHAQAAGAIGLPIDRWAFVLAFAVALAGMIYAGTRRAPARFQVEYDKELGRSILLCAAVACALSVAVATELVLTGIRFSGSALCASAFVPALSLVLECAAVGSLAICIRTTMLRRAAAARLFP